MPEDPGRIITMLNSHGLAFGKLAIEAGYISSEQLDECLSIQRKMTEMGIKAKPIGEILFERTYLSREQAQKIFNQQLISGNNAYIAGFKILKRLGEGSMGTVYKALQLSMDRPVALKTIKLKYSKNDKFRERFFREARAVAMLNHENIVAGYDVGEESGIAYFAMEHIDGPSVQNILDRSGRIEENIALNIILQISRGLNHASQHGMVHRDIKPDNIMINRAGVAKLCDLGLARLGRDEQVKKSRVVGTPLFISPEQAQGIEEVDTRADIYSLGATFYYMVTGRTPFLGDTAAEMLKMHIREPVVPPEKILPGVSRAVNEAIMIMLSKKPEDRFQSAEKLIAALQKLLQKRDEEALQGRLQKNIAKNKGRTTTRRLKSPDASSSQGGSAKSSTSKLSPQQKPKRVVRRYKL